MSAGLRVYISSSWKNKDRVRAIANGIRLIGHEVYDFTDPACRKTPEIPPEKYPKDFDPTKQTYREYLSGISEWYDTVEENRRALHWANVVLLLLPSGNDAHADAFYGLGRGAVLAVVGQPKAGERSTTHLWAHTFLDNDSEVLEWLERIARSKAAWQ
jgi:hypothetical protein